MELSKIIDFTFFDKIRTDTGSFNGQECPYSYKILIIIENFNKEQFSAIYPKCDYIISNGEAANNLYENFSKNDESEKIPTIDCIIDTEELNEDAANCFKKKKSKVILHKEGDSDYLAKGLYFSLEIISAKNESNNIDERNAIFILTKSTRFDFTYSIINDVIGFFSSYENEINNTDVFFICESHYSVFLKNGTTWINPSAQMENQIEGYSLTPLCHFTNLMDVKISEYMFQNEYLENTEIFEKTIQTGNPIFFRRKTKFDKLKITLESEKNSLLLYASTSVFVMKN